MTHQVNFANELNPVQWEAARTTKGPLLILAGAGSGKTRALTYRIAYLVAIGEATPGEILAVTFTNKAAKEMAERATKLLSRIGHHVDPREPLWISTFHSTCARILRQHIPLLGYKRDFTIYDDGEQLSVIKKICAQLNINDKMYPPKNFQYHINQSKNQYLNPQKLKGRKVNFLLDEKIAAVYELYEKQMQLSNALDFGDLLFKTTELFEKNPQLLAQYQERFRFIMVDEYQDTNHVQYVLIKMLAEKFKNICVVGDEDQSIYSWRGADITNILSFEKDFPGAKIVKLEENYRSTKNIVEAASHVIKKNTERKDKTLWTNNEAGSPIMVREEMNEFEEARSVIKEIAALCRDDNRVYNEFAVFYRTNAQSRVLEDQLRSQGIPYKLIGGTKFYERLEIKDILCYLRLCLNPKDDVGLKRIINSPTRGIGKISLEKLEAFATSRNESLYESILPALQEKVFDRGASQKILGFYELIHSLIDKSKTLTPSEVYHAVLDSTHYVQKLKLEDTPEASSRVENLEQLDTAIKEFEQERGDEGTLAAFLEEVALVTDTDRKLEDAAHTEFVTLMTLHISKGLEYPVVFIVGLEEGLFPSIRDNESDSDQSSEEERRLFYVGMTRARERLYLSHARTRKIWGNEQSHPASRFLGEIPEQYIKKLKLSLGNIPQWRRTFNTPKSDFDSDSHSIMPSYEDFGDHDQGLKKGMRVKHPSFGVGIVHQLEGKGESQMVTILFSNNSLKKFVTKFARLEKA